MMEIENINNEVVCKGDKDVIIKFLNDNGFSNLDISTPILIVGNLIKNKYSLYIR